MKPLTSIGSSFFTRGDFYKIYVEFSEKLSITYHLLVIFTAHIGRVVELVDTQD